jgi:hypothetical protein
MEGLPKTRTLEAPMSKEFKPGENTGKGGGIFQEVGPRGGERDNYATVPDNRPLPPTSSSGSTWKRIDRTPDSHR